MESSSEKRLRVFPSGGMIWRFCLHRGRLYSHALDVRHKKEDWIHAWGTSMVPDRRPFKIEKHRCWNHMVLLEKGLSIPEIIYSTHDPTRLTPDTIQKMEFRLRDLIGGKPFVVINPNAAWASKRWLPERLAEVADRVTELWMVPILVGSPKEKCCQEVKEIYEDCSLDLYWERQTCKSLLPLCPWPDL